MRLIETRGAKIGRCNICGNVGNLTDDHTPPKGCTRIGAVQLHYITERLNVGKTKSNGRISQNGVKYRTLCAHCNSTMLGIHYDPTFIDFVNSISSILKSDLYLPGVIPIKTKPQRVMRSLLGHLSAQGVNGYNKGEFTEPIRDYILDETKPLPDSLKIYFWLYPFRHYIMARDCAYKDFQYSEHVLIWFLKFYPVAFMITFKEPDSYAFPFPFYCLSSWGQEQIDFEIDVQIDLWNIPPEDWPETPSNHSQSLRVYGQEAIVSFRHEKKKT